MTTASIHRTTHPFITTQFLSLSATLWYGIAVIGLMAFFVYVVIEYGFGLVHGSEAVSSSFIDDDAVGNAFLFTHLSLALVVIAGGLVQLIPYLRTRYPALHRWNGRAFVLCALVCSGTGQFLISTRDIPGDFFMHLGTSVSGVLVFSFAFMAVKYARNKAFVEHRKWALRLFLVANAGWFFRIGLMFWFTVNQGPAGIDINTFTGPPLIVIAYAQFLLPLATLELYFRAQKSGSGVVKGSVATLITLLALITLAGVAAASMGMWFPTIMSGGA